MKKKFVILAAAAALVASSSATAYAVSLTDTDVVGAYGQLSTGNELSIAQHLLDMAANTSDPTACNIATACYQTGSTEYSGTLDSTFDTGGFGSSYSLSGYDYILVKYDGESAGYVLFATGGNTFNVPNVSSPLWTTSTNQYHANNWWGFNTCTGNACNEEESTPDGGSTAALLGAALFGIAFVRRRFGK